MDNNKDLFDLDIKINQAQNSDQVSPANITSNQWTTLWMGCDSSYNPPPPSGGSSDPIRLP